MKIIENDIFLIVFFSNILILSIIFLDLYEAVPNILIGCWLKVQLRIKTVEPFCGVSSRTIRAEMKQNGCCKCTKNKWNYFP